MMTDVTALKSFSDEKLAVRAADGSGECFEELVCRYSLRLYRYLRPKTVSDQEAEDLIQETFRKAFQAIAQFDPNYRFSTWLFTIAHRLAVSLFRSRKAPAEDRDLGDDSLNPEGLFIRRQEAQNLWTLARRLPRRQYEVLWLRYTEDLSVEEIARVMKTTSPHVRVLLHRGRTKLAAVLREADPEARPAPARKMPIL